MLRSQSDAVGSEPSGYPPFMQTFWISFICCVALAAKISTSILRLIVLDLLKEGKEGVYGSVMLDQSSKITMASRISTSWVLRFQDNHGLHSRRQAGELQFSPEKTEEMERAVSRHLGKVRREFESGHLDENFVENGDETHFIMNMNNGKTLAAINEKEVKYADVVTGGVGMTMFVRLSGGARSQLQPAFFVFQSTGSYPIRGVDDNVPGVSYRVGKRG
jgi:hypothetical protein